MSCTKYVIDHRTVSRLEVRVYVCKVGYIVVLMDDDKGEKES